MEMAINQEKVAAENLRTLVSLTVQAGAGGNNLTEARRAEIIIAQRQALFIARRNLIFVKYFVTDGLAVAHDAIGGQNVDDLLSNEDKKRIAESRIFDVVLPNVPAFDHAQPVNRELYIFFSGSE